METILLAKPIHISDGYIFDTLSKTEGVFYLGYTDNNEEIHKHCTINAPSYEMAQHVMKIFIKALLFKKYNYFLSMNHFHDFKRTAQFKGLGWYDAEGNIILSDADFHKGIYKIDGKNYAMYFTEIAGLNVLHF